MVHSRQEQILAPLLDRLIDEEPGVNGEPVQRRQATVAALESSVRRDLEKLLNTKSFPFSGVLSGYRQLAASVFCYGMADFTACNPRSPAVRSQLREEIERAVKLFEPRLSNVAVRVEPPDREERKLRFTISALLVFGQIGEPVTFDTYFDASKGEYRILQ